MKVGLLLAAGLGLVISGASAQQSTGATGATLNVATWGGAYGQSQEIAFFEPFAKETGTKIAMEIYDGSLAKLKGMIDGTSTTMDVVDVSSSALGTLCNDGLLEKISITTLGAPPGGQSIEDDFLAGGLSTCGVASVAWSTAIAFDRKAFSKGEPTEISALLDTTRFPGKRALPKAPRYTLELVLLADGVPPESIYSELGTEAGADRAFAALDKIRDNILFWDNAEEPITWLLEEKAAMAAGYSGRIFRAAVGDQRRIGVLWDGQIYDIDAWAIPKAAKNKEEAIRFISFATSPARLAEQAQLIAYGPMRKSAVELVGKHPIINVEMQGFLPTAPDNFKKALKFDDAWWNANGAALTKRFADWQTQVEAAAAAKEAERKAKEAQSAEPVSKAAP
ncbi:extracellular solute-binding protein [Methyloceanibacter sp.]|uniref:extracellular solute-binding protein n=1 Tax=Methyloceanibacter sp. TaxID=1965321 RepID=UPI003D6D8651